MTIGIVSGSDLVAAVIYNNLRFPNIEMSIASTSPRWCTRPHLEAVFAYPFRQLGVRRVTAVTDEQNRPVRAFLARLGFIHEGTMRHALPTGDAVIYGMVREECRWLRQEGRIVKRRTGQPATGD